MKKGLFGKPCSFLDDSIKCFACGKVTKINNLDFRFFEISKTGAGYCCCNINSNQALVITYGDNAEFIGSNKANLIKCS